ncbi:hypothetical protein [Coralloluteibacterium stylophorae]|uniref:Lipoprotein n=1 Tax=Coralloluteibacterium stylophorae TaxID=1776034 RepID=A0A8J7VRP9_9GAMM|nr:hypothetical protein [Coralloluteibacterium stylophorae]MBS7456887.1 hypothetical protein [Coralloluteibacterium stylophorae]
MRSWSQAVIAFAIGGLLAACQAETAPEDADADPATAEGGHAEAFDAACATIDADTGELLPGGRLAQLDIEFRYRAARTGDMRSGDVQMRLDAESQVEGTASQLVCLWERYGYTQFEFEGTNGQGPVGLPAQSRGTAFLRGERLIRAADSRVHEQVSVGGPLELLRVGGITERDGTGPDDICVILEYDAALGGEGQRTITAPGIHRQEAMPPGELVGDSHSAMAARSFGESEHHLMSRSFSICAGEEPSGPTATGDAPRGLRISDDDRTWTRSGSWVGHLSAPAETRTVDFTMHVVPPTLALDGS